MSLASSVAQTGTHRHTHTQTHTPGTPPALGTASAPRDTVPGTPARTLAVEVLGLVCHWLASLWALTLQLADDEWHSGRVARAKELLW